MEKNPKNPVWWFEIPVQDMERAIAFYKEVFGFSFIRHPLGPIDMALFPSYKDANGSAGALVKHETRKPSATDGILIYFRSPSGNVANELAKAQAAGGKIIMDRKEIGEEIGFMGIFLDCEGNRIAIHSKE